jgi:hypothetical protein
MSVPMKLLVVAQRRVNHALCERSDTGPGCTLMTHWAVLSSA